MRKGQGVEAIPDWYVRFSNYKECAKIGCYSRTFSGHKFCKGHDESGSHQIDCVYFAWSPEAASVKIGYSSNIKKRLIGLQTSSPYELVLFAYITGNKEFEAALHENLKDYRLKGEWFMTSDKVINVMSIAKHRGQIGIEDYLNES